jgi:hypothetical protein
VTQGIGCACLVATFGRIDALQTKGATKLSDGLMVLVHPFLCLATSIVRQMRLLAVWESVCVKGAQAGVYFPSNR